MDSKEDRSGKAEEQKKQGKIFEGVAGDGGLGREALADKSRREGEILERIRTFEQNTSDLIEGR